VIKKKNLTWVIVDDFQLDNLLNTWWFKSQP